MAWYDLEETKNKYDPGKDEDGNFVMSDKIYKKFQEKNVQVIRNILEIGMPKKNEQLRLITNNSFNSIAFVEHVARTEGIKSSKFVIFSINMSAAHLLIDLKNDNLIKNTELIISIIRNAGFKTKSKAVELLKHHFDIIFLNSHAKIVVMETEKGNYYTLEGSGNFSHNERIEQYVIDNDKLLFDFSEKWIEEIKNNTQYKYI